MQIIKYKKIRHIVAFATLVAFVLLSCASNRKIVDKIEEYSSEIQVGNLSVLNKIPNKDLRVANDSETGTLYYAGLIWYFENDLKKALIAFKRSARTAPAPWKKEAARLVGSIYTEEFDYVPLAEFYESLNSLDFFASDPELFYYYSQCLWALKKYEPLQTLVQMAELATWRATPKSRITVAEARFAIKTWKFLLSVMDSPSQIETELEKLVLQSSSFPLLHSISAFLERFIDTVKLPPETLDVINAKLHYLENTEAALDLYLALPDSYITYKPVQRELIQSARKTRNGLAKAYNKLLTVQKLLSSNASRIILLSSIARVEFLRSRYNSSYKYCKAVLSLLDSLPNSTIFIKENISTLNDVFNSYLYVTVKKYPDVFVSEFISHVSPHPQPGYFSSLLEEYLHYMLKEQRYTQLHKDLQKINAAFPQTEMQFELQHWKTMLHRASNGSSPDALSITFKNMKIFRSIFLFDYFIAHSSDAVINSEAVLDIFPEKNNSFTENEVNALVHGHIKFGLFEYARTMSLGNIGKISFENIKAISTHMTDNGEFHKGYILSNKLAYFRPWEFTQSEDLKLIYPHAYKEIVHSLTNNPIEQALILGVIREESSFSPIARSPANAVGLTQLLPSTAQDIATRIEYGTYSIENPEDNIALGYNYLQYLIRILKNPLKAILAYNGGIGNVWEWEERLNKDDLFLFASAIPFRETRHYLRKVLSSTIAYGILYYGLDPQEIISYVEGSTKGYEP